MLVVAGDDHTCKSSSLPHQSEYNFIDAMMPVLNPADVQEIVELGLLRLRAVAFQRLLGRPQGDAGNGRRDAVVRAVAARDADRDARVFDMPPGGLNIRWPDPPNDQECRLQRYKLRAALAFARANGLEPHGRSRAARRASAS